MTALKNIWALYYIKQKDNEYKKSRNTYNVRSRIFVKVHSKLRYILIKLVGL